jgi:hypothetical protein
VRRLLKRMLVSIPFAIAFVLNVFVIAARPLGWRLKHIEGYVFLFGTPWAWLLDRGWFGVHNKLAEEILTYAMLLWIPALLYSLCLWLLLKVFGIEGWSSCSSFKKFGSASLRVSLFIVKQIGREQSASMRPKSGVAKPSL